MVLTILDAAFRHGAGRDAHDREACRVFAVRGAQLALQRHRLERRKSFPRKPRMIEIWRGGSKCDQVDTGVACDRRAQLSGNLGIAGRRQAFDVAAFKHDAAIAGAGGHQRAADLDAMRLRRERGQREPEFFQRRRRVVHMRHEMRKMVEIELAGFRCLGRGQLGEGGRRHSDTGGRRAIKSISMRASRASPLTPTQVRAGRLPAGKYSA